MAMPAQAEVKGVYAGIKFIDSLQSTGITSRDANFGFFGMGTYVQNSVGGGIFAGYNFYPQLHAPIRIEVEYDMRTNMTTEWSDKISSRTGSIDATWGMQTLFANVYWDFYNPVHLPHISAAVLEWASSIMTMKYLVVMVNKCHFPSLTLYLHGMRA